MATRRGSAPRGGPGFTVVVGVDATSPSGIAPAEAIIAATAKPLSTVPVVHVVRR